MGAWIETTISIVRGVETGSHPYMGAWIETSLIQLNVDRVQSHPYMGAWIEILKLIYSYMLYLLSKMYNCTYNE